ncbi:Armadillo/betacatenin-like repeat domain containing protein, partial [Acanthamoeba castellanii str. Neff]
ISIEDKYAAIVGAQPGSFAFLFGLACKHPSEHVQKYAIHTIFSLSRNDKNKETIATKWFLVLAKLFASPNQSIQTLATAIMAEISIGYDEAKAKATKEIGVLKIVPLLKSGSSEQRYEACRLLTNITNKQAEVQKAAVKEGLLALLLGIATNRIDNNRRTQTAALSAVANILALVGDKETDMGADFARENVTGAIVTILKEARGQDRETEELQEQNLRAIVGITKHKALSAEFIEKEGVEALTPLLGPANKELQKQAVRTIKNLSKKYKKRLAAKETLLDSLQSVATESSSTNVQKVAKKTLSRLQLSTK